MDRETYSIDREVARENGEPIPSYVKVRRYKGRDDYPAALGYYYERFRFEPLRGQPLKEAICCRPEEIEETELP